MYPLPEIGFVNLRVAGIAAAVRYFLEIINDRKPQCAR